MESLDNWIWIIKDAVHSELSHPRHSSVTQLSRGGRRSGQFKQSVRRKHEQVSPHVHWAKRTTDCTSSHFVCSVYMTFLEAKEGNNKVQILCFCTEVDFVCVLQEYLFF